MKKQLSAILALAIILAVFAQLYAFAVPSNLTNIALGCTYEASVPYTARTYPNDYQLIDGKELTDGVKGEAPYGTIWHGFYNERSYFATIDLGGVKSGIVKLSMTFENIPSASVLFPSKVVYSISSDGKTFTDIGETVPSGGTIADAPFVIPEGVSGRYVKATMTSGGGMFVFCSEFEVFTGTLGDEETSNPSVEETNGMSDSDYKNPKDKTAKKDAPAPVYTSIRTLFNSGEFVQKDYTSFDFAGKKIIRGVLPGTTLEDFVKTLGYTEGLVIYDASGNVKTTGKMKTGDKLVLGSDTAYVIIEGDVNGDGVISAPDYLYIKRFVLRVAEGTNFGYCAADADASGAIKANDYLLIKRHFLKMHDLFAKYEDTDREEESASTLTKNSATLYTIATTDSELGKVTITLDKKSWGTWNLGAWSVAGTRVAGGGTDWEYVYRSGTTFSTSFTGGNHENEVLLDIKFYDNASDEEIVLANGASKSANGVRIVEKTQICYAGTSTAFMNVTRTYYIIGTRITLECEYELLRDTYFSSSYSCMFPVSKTQGRFITFHKANGDDVSFTSLKVGYADYSGPQYGNTNATSATITGFGGKDVKFDISVYGEDAHWNFDCDLKTFYWDMNAVENKLYFTIFNNSASKVVKGVKWSTKASWKVSPNE